MEPIIAVIPARGGSKGIEHKNLREIEDASLVARAVKTVLQSRLKKVYVYSDDTRINLEATMAGGTACYRPADVSYDNTTSEETIARFLSTHDEKRVVKAVMMLQCTSPFLRAEHINAALEKWATGKFDSLVGVVRNYKFLGHRGPDGCEFLPVWPLRQRRQDMDNDECYWSETGSLYMAKRKLWESGQRIGNRCGVVEHYYWESVEVDELIDLQVCRDIARTVSEYVKDRRQYD